MYIVREGERGGCVTALAVADFNATVAELAARGIVGGPIKAEGEGAWKALVADRDGNMLTLLEVADA